MLIEGRPVESVDTVAAQQSLVGPGYMEAMRIGLVSGRYFADGDDERGSWSGDGESDVRAEVLRRGRSGGPSHPSRRTAVDGAMAHGRRRRARRAQRWSGSRSAAAVISSPCCRRRASSSGWSCAVASTASRCLATSRARSPASIPICRCTASGPYDDIVARSIGQRRLAMQLLSVFAAAAVLLSAVGLYGVMSYFVGLRQKELGIRLAIGASPRDLGRLVLSRGAWLTPGRRRRRPGRRHRALGSRQRSAVPDHAARPADVRVSTMLLVSVALLACWLPARRAARLDPVRTLRAE